MNLDAMQKIKLCAVTTVPITMEKFVVEAMDYLARNGYEVTLVCSMDDEFIARYQNRFRCVHVPMCRGFDLFGAVRATWRLFRLFRREQFDIVQYATPNAASYASFASWLARIPARIYCQWGVRYIGYEGVRKRVYRELERIVCRLSTHIRPASQKNLQFAVDERLYAASKGEVIGAGGTIGVDFSIFDVKRKEGWRKGLRTEFSLSGKTVFGFVGTNLRRDKGVNELLAAFKQLREQRCDVALMLLGDHLEQDPIDGELREWSEGCKDVHYLGLAPDAFRYMSAMDILVHPSYREGFSMVIQEAAAMALPVITTDIPGPSEVIENEVTGVLVPPRDAAVLFQAMERLADDPKLRSDMGEAGLERDRRLFARGIMLEKTLLDRNKIAEESR